MRSQVHRTKQIPHIFSLAHDLIEHGLIVAQINSAQVVMFLEKAQFSPAQISSFRVLVNHGELG